MYASQTGTASKNAWHIMRIAALAGVILYSDAIAKDITPIVILVFAIPRESSRDLY